MGLTEPQEWVLNRELRKVLFCILEEDKIRSITHKITYANPRPAITVCVVLYDVEWDCWLE